MIKLVHSIISLVWTRDLRRHRFLTLNNSVISPPPPPLGSRCANSEWRAAQSTQGRQIRGEPAAPWPPWAHLLQLLYIKADGKFNMIPEICGPNEACKWNELHPFILSFVLFVLGLSLLSLGSILIGQVTNRSAADMENTSLYVASLHVVSYEDTVCWPWQKQGRWRHSEWWWF